MQKEKKRLGFYSASILIPETSPPVLSEPAQDQEDQDYDLGTGVSDFCHVLQPHYIHLNVCSLRSLPRDPQGVSASLSNDAWLGTLSTLHYSKCTPYTNTACTLSLAYFVTKRAWRWCDAESVTVQQELATSDSAWHASPNTTRL